MELFIPSLLAIIIAAAIVMFVLPRFSPVILGVVALVFLVLAAYNHYNFFAYEYRQSTWQLPLVSYAPYIILGALVLFLLFFIINFIGTGSTDMSAPIQSMNDAINKVAEKMPKNMTEAINQVKDTANNTLANAGLAARTNGVRNLGAPPANVARPPGNVRFSQI
jgi:predicted PurR-regulated permease PerM